MANIKSASPRCAVVSPPLSGISSENPRSGGATEMENFRFSADGAIEKRWGYTPTLGLKGKPRAIFSGYVRGKEERFFLIRDEVFCETPEQFPGYTLVGRVESVEGDAAFVSFLGDLYLLDGKHVYLYTGNGLEIVEGYIPLYGDGWDPILRGEICEAENRMTPRLRIRYRNPNGEKNLYFGRKVVQIDRAVIDGEELLASEITIINDGYGCTSAAFEYALDIEVLLVAARESDASIEQSTGAFSFGRASDNCLFCYGGDDPTVVYASRGVLPSAADASDLFGRTIGGRLYFSVDDPPYRLQAPLTAVCRHNDRVLLFTAEGTWGVECEGDRFSVVTVHPSMGCDKKNGALLCMNTPITCFGGKLLRFNEKLNRASECSAEVISAPVADVMQEICMHPITMAYYRASGELWIAAESDAPGRVLIYHPERGVFYTYTGIYLDRLLPSSGEASFCKDGTLYALDRSSNRDCGTREIVARYRTGYFSFGDEGKRKRFLGFTGEVVPDGGRILLRVKGDCGGAAPFMLSGKGSADLPLHVEGRRRFGRFRYLSCSIVCPGEARQRIVALKLFAKV